MCYDIGAGEFFYKPNIRIDFWFNGQIITPSSFPGLRSKCRRECWRFLGCCRASRLIGGVKESTQWYFIPTGQLYATRPEAGIGGDFIMHLPTL